MEKQSTNNWYVNKTIFTNPVCLSDTNKKKLIYKIFSPEQWVFTLLLLVSHDKTFITQMRQFSTQKVYKKVP